MNNRRLIALLAVLFLLAGTLLAASFQENHSQADEVKKQSKMIDMQDSDFDIDLTELRQQLEKLRKIELDAIRKALAEIPGQLEKVRVELANLPAQLKAMNHELKQVPGVLERVEKELDTLPAKLESMGKELEKLKHLNLDKTIEQALESLEGLDERIEKAVEKAVEKKRNDH
ncbi:MAG TPA: hypothetical protein ENN40_01120 [Candidatus Aminicenantes bacterium]|nr:hypothetical protein [Candidatus Aminicenantes bacterium]